MFYWNTPQCDPYTGDWSHFLHTLAQYVKSFRYEVCEVSPYFMLTFQNLAKFRKMLGYSMKGGQAPIVVGVIVEIRFILIHGGPLESLECCIIHLASYVHETELIRNDAI